MKNDKSLISKNGFWGSWDGNPNVILNSFIISNTPFQQVRWW